jgi:hypothetical protein
MYIKAVTKATEDMTAAGDDAPQSHHGPMGHGRPWLLEFFIESPGNVNIEAPVCCLARLSH